MRVCVRVSVSVHADQVVTALTPSKSSQYHMKGGGGLWWVAEFDFAIFQGLCACVFC